MNVKEIAGFIRNVPDFPKPGIQFKDITTLLQYGDALAAVVDHLADRYRDKNIEQVVGIEARGFIFGAALAYALKTGFVIVRKPGKLPAKTRSVTYDLEYGTDTVEIHEDAIREGQKVLIIDDLLATGGTVGAVSKMVKEMGGVIHECAFVIELDFLKGGEKLEGIDYYSLIHF